jgi:hypothetical protein
MKNTPLAKFAALALLLLGLWMIVIGIQHKLLPPPLTGIGFIIIAFVFFGRKE